MRHSVKATNLVNVSKRLALGAFLMASVSAVPLSSAMAQAAITWGGISVETGNASDVVTTGTIVEAATTGSTSTLNGVTFGVPTGTTGTIGFSGSSVTLSNVAGLGYYTNGTSGWDPNYISLVNAGAFGFGNSGVLELGGLSAGHNYLIQIFEVPWDINWSTAFTDGTNSSGYLNLYGDAVGISPASTVNDYVTGTFTASGSGQSIDLLAANGITIFGAVQVRDVTQTTSPTIPEPGSLPLMAIGLMGLVGLARRNLVRK